MSAARRAMSLEDRWRRLVGFFVRQYRDLRAGGSPVVVRKLLMTFDVVLAIPFVLAARLLRPFVLIRFGGLPSDAIGHLTSDMELFLCRKDAGWYGRRTVDLFCSALPVCNEQLKRMWERTVHVGRFTLAAERINRWLPGGQANRIPFDSGPMDTHGFFATTPPHLSFTLEEQRRGIEALRQLGIPEGRPFICFHARDAAYYAGKPRYGNQRYRNSDVLTYFPAVEALVQRGYSAIRMGAAVERPLPSGHAQIIDYATRARTDFLDIYLCAHCDFYLGDGAGLYNVPAIFRRPLALVNYIPFEYPGTWNPYDLFIPKLFWLRSESRLMTFREVLESGVGRALRDEQYEQLGVEVVNNTADEIAALVIEMSARCAGTWQATPEDEELQRQFWKMVRASTAIFAFAPWKTHWRMGAEFLRQHQVLLERVTKSNQILAWTPN